VDGLIKQVSVSWRADSLEQNMKRLSEAEYLANDMLDLDGKVGGDRNHFARIYYWMGRVHYVSNKMPEAIEYFEQVLEMAEELDDPELRAIHFMTIGSIKFVQGHLDTARELLIRAIPLLEQMGNWPEWIRALGFHSMALAMSGDREAGLAEAQRADARAKEIKSIGEIALSQTLLGVVYHFAGDLPHAIEAGRLSAEAGEQSKERLYVSHGHAWRSWAECRAGDFKNAAESMESSQAVLQEWDGLIIAADWRAAISAELALGIGPIEEALCLADRAIDIAQEIGGIFAEGMARRTKGQALAALTPPQWDEALAELAESLRLLESGENRVEAAYTRLAWGKVCRDRGDFTAAREHWELAAAQWEASGLTDELERTLSLIENLDS
jgi:tetratricopeptide (TPR) repeat protein